MNRDTASGQPGLRRANAAALVQALVAHGPTPRAELARLTGVTAPTVTKIAGELIDHRVLTETAERAPTAVGRPRVPVQLDTASWLTGGIQVGRTATAVGLVDLAGRAVAADVLPHPHHSVDQPSESLERAADRLGHLAADHPGRPLLGIGMITPGTVADGTVLDHPQPGWTGAPAADLLAAAWRSTPGRPALPDTHLHAESMVRGRAVAELRLGAARGLSDALILMLGDAVGASMITGGRVLDGAAGRAGRIDHLRVGPPVGVRCTCGRRDCLRALCGGPALLAAAPAGAGETDSAPDLDALLERARDGDEAVADLLRERAGYVGEAVGQLADLLDPERIAVAGWMLDAPGALRSLRGAAAAPWRRDPEQLIVPTGLTPHPQVRTAAAAVLDAFYRDPLGMLRALE